MLTEHMTEEEFVALPEGSLIAVKVESSRHSGLRQMKVCGPAIGRVVKKRACVEVNTPGSPRDGEAHLFSCYDVQCRWEVLEENSNNLAKKREQVQSCAETFTRMLAALKLPLKLNNQHEYFFIEVATRDYPALQAAAEAVLADRSA